MTVIDVTGGLKKEVEALREGEFSICGAQKKRRGDI